MDPAEEERTLAYGGFLRMLLAAGTLLVVTLGLQLPRSVFGPALNPVRDAAWVLWPQGWNLFSEGEQNTETVAYAPGPGGDWVSALVTPQVQARDLWGLARTQRIQAHEVTALAARVPDVLWHGCDAPSVQACVEDGAPATVRMASPVSHPTLCGPIALTVEAPAPWGRRGTAGVWTVRRMVLLQVDC